MDIKTTLTSPETITVYNALKHYKATGDHGQGKVPDDEFMDGVIELIGDYLKKAGYRLSP